MTYKELVEKLLSVLASHNLVNETMYGLPYNVNEFAAVGRKYILAVLVPTTSPTTSETIAFGFTLTTMDVISKTEDNRLQIQSDCIKVLADFIRQVNENEDFDLVGPPSITAFQENFSDYCAGASMDIQILIPFEDICITPFE